MGPRSIGKTCIAELIVKELKWTRYSLDDEFWDILESDEEFTSADKDELVGLNLLSPKRQPFHAHAIKLFLSNYAKMNCVCDFGYVHPIFDDESTIKQIVNLLADYPNVVLLLPSEKRSESIQEMRDIFNKYECKMFPELEEEIDQKTKYVIDSSSIYKFAKITIYTKGKTLEEICKEILQSVKII